VEGKGVTKLPNSGVVLSFCHYKGGIKGSDEITQQSGNFITPLVDNLSLPVVYKYFC
jgi:hypothetical protein